MQRILALQCLISHSLLFVDPGNIEYLGYLESGDWVEKTFDLQGLVEQSHAALDHGKEGAGC